MSIQVVSVLDKPPTVDYLVRGWTAFNKSLQRFGHEPLILGLGSPWKGLGSKPKLLKKAIESGQVKSDYILFCDCLDVAFLESPEEISGYAYTKMIMEDSRIMWGAERFCFPQGEWAEHFPATEFPYKYLNSGLSIGSTQDYLQILTEMKVDERPDDYLKPDGSWHHENDQGWFLEKYLWGQCGENELKMTLDNECYIFQNMVGETMKNFELKKGHHIFNRTTETSPMVLHWNGFSKTAGTMEPILEHLDLL
jgi:hypothetical protein